MVVTWIVGVQGVASGFATASFLRGGAIASVDPLSRGAGGEPLEYLVAVYASAERLSLAEAYETAFPLAIAAVLLSGMLVLASGLALAGRRGAQSFALQAIAANAGLAVLSYVLLEPVRAGAVAAALDAARKVTLAPTEVAFASPTFWLWLGRVRLYVGELAVLGAAAIAVTRPRARTYFRAAAEAIEQAEEP